ncbi:hypothetical protein TELCIR_19843, partial [Teladorsagia circumcincta]
IRKGDVVWAPYRRDPLWPALSIRALSVDDVLPSHCTTDLIEAFEAAIQYLNKRGLPRGSAAPQMNTKVTPKGAESTVVRSTVKPSVSNAETVEQDVSPKQELPEEKQQTTDQCDEGTMDGIEVDSNKGTWHFTRGSRENGALHTVRE